MRKGMWSAAAVVTLVAGGIVLLIDPAARAADSRVTAGSSSDPLKFLPPDITVPVGTTVIWRNDSDLPHDVSADDGSFDSDGTFDKGKEFKFTFTTPGSFSYFCTPHKDAQMKGTVTVAGGSSTPTTATTATTAAPAAGGATTTTARGAPASTTTTTTRPGAGDSGGSTTTTTAGSGVTSTTQASATTPTSGPESGGVTTTTAPGTDSHADEEALETHSGAGGSDSNPVGIALVGILTAVLAAISLKLLTAKP